MILTQLLKLQRNPVNNKLTKNFYQKCCYSSEFGKKNSKSMIIKDIIKKWTNVFEQEKISEPRLSAEYIVGHVLDVKSITEVRNKNSILTAEQVALIEKLCKNRLLHMPVQYVIGEWDFRDIKLKLAPPVFIPRPETEILVELILDDIRKRRQETLNFIEIGCGSGAISLSLLKSCPNLYGIAVDRSIDACHLTESNAKMLKLADRLMVLNRVLREEHLLAELSNKHVDFIVSNPPYVPEKDMRNLQSDIKLYEDLAALDGGADGLNIINLLLRLASIKLFRRGMLYLEVDSSHPVLIDKILKKNKNLKLHIVHVYKDYNNKERFLKIEKI